MCFEVLFFWCGKQKSCSILDCTPTVQRFAVVLHYKEQYVSVLLTYFESASINKNMHLVPLHIALMVLCCFVV
jgi:hypothetical protein